MGNRIKLFIVGIILSLFLISCSNSKPTEVKDVDFYWYNWFDTQNKTTITLRGDISVISPEKNVDGFGGDDFLNTYTYFYADGEIYFNNEILKVNDSSEDYTNLYFYNNNYFYVYKSKYNNRSCHVLKVINTYLYVTDNKDNAYYHSHYNLPLPPKIEYEKNNNSVIYQMFELYDYDYMVNFYSKFTNYVTLDNANKTIKLVSEEIYLSNHTGKPNVYVTTTIDYTNKTISVKNDNIDVVL